MRGLSSRSAMGVIALAAIQSTAFAQGTFDRSKPPELGPPPRVALPPILTRELPNGLKLLIVEHHELPLADFVLLVGSGSTTDPASKTGVANLTATMLREGTTTRKSLDIADQIAYLGINLSPSSSWESSTLSLHTPTAQLDSALALFADVALRPSFPADEFERLRKNRLTDLLRLRDQGPAIANLVFPAIIYGGTHPYGAATLGTEASVKSLSVTDLQSYYQTNFKPNNSTLIIVGDVNPAQIEQKINALFGDGSVHVSQPRTQIRRGRGDDGLSDRQPGAARPRSELLGRSAALDEGLFALSLSHDSCGSFTTGSCRTCGRLALHLRATPGFDRDATPSFLHRPKSLPQKPILPCWNS